VSELKRSVVDAREAESEAMVLLLSARWEWRRWSSCCSSDREGTAARSVGREDVELGGGESAEDGFEDGEGSFAAAGLDADIVKAERRL
jgi:hypothetical protein